MCHNIESVHTTRIDVGRSDPLYTSDPIYYQHLVSSGSLSQISELCSNFWRIPHK